jgi:hypothetical protein
LLLNKPPRDGIASLATEEATERWFAEHDPEGVAFEYEVMN